MWFLTVRDRRGRKLAERICFKSEAAEVRCSELRQAGSARDLELVTCRVTMNLAEPKCLRFDYTPNGPAWQKAQGQFEQFWHQDVRR